ncbi:hypothetical protein [Aureimonas altamirensis]|uniref:hypothetical protein n=1 Tax=Aureimonas altamirensis TaxID=370622 RepID=UPI0025563A5F|nr:hypothetical protein [Aureimonas altamirensis]
MTAARQLSDAKPLPSCVVPVATRWSLPPLAATLPIEGSGKGCRKPTRAPVPRLLRTV